MTVLDAPHDAGVRLDGVALAGETPAGTTVVSGLALVIDGRGVTVVGPSPAEARTVAWQQASSVSFREPAALPDGSPATVLRIGVQDRSLRFLVPVDRVPPTQTAAVESRVAALAGQQGATPAPVTILPPPPPPGSFLPSPPPVVTPVAAPAPAATLPPPPPEATLPPPPPGATLPSPPLQATLPPPPPEATLPPPPPEATVPPHAPGATLPPPPAPGLFVPPAPAELLGAPPAPPPPVAPFETRTRSTRQKRTEAVLPPLFGSPAPAAPAEDDTAAVGPPTHVYAPVAPPGAFVTTGPVPVTVAPQPWGPSPAPLGAGYVAGAGRAARWSRSRLALIGIAAVVLVGGLVWFGAGRALHTGAASADQTLAAKVNITAADLGATWRVDPGATSSATSATGPQDASRAASFADCMGNPDARQVVTEPTDGAGESSPVFSDDGGATDVSSQADVAPSSDEIQQELAVVSSPRFPACMQSFIAGVLQSSAAGQKVLPAPAPSVSPLPAVAGTHGLVVSTPVTVPGRGVLAMQTAYIASGRVEVSVSMAAADKRVNTSLFEQLTQTVARRAAAAGGA